MKVFVIEPRDYTRLAKKVWVKIGVNWGWLIKRDRE